MAELEPKRLAVSLRNHEGAIGVPGDLRQTWPVVIEHWRAKHGERRPDLLTACPPCQGMSSARSGMGGHTNPDDGNRDPRNLLVEVVAQVIAELQPRMVVLENVPQFLTRLVRHPDTGLGLTAAQLLMERVGAAYDCFPVVLDAADYGVPQTRRRMFLTLVHHDEPSLGRLKQKHRAPYPAPTHVGKQVTFAEAVGKFNLQPLDPRTIATATATDDVLHSVPVWNKPDDRRYDMVAATSPDGGSAWENDTCINGHKTHGLTDKAVQCPTCGGLLFRPLVLDKVSGEWRLIKGFKTSYRRLSLGTPASTVTTASGHIGSDITIHPTEHRLLSIRECAILQTFPDDFDWGDTVKSWGSGKVREMIGEAVPPKFTFQHGKILQSLIDNEEDATEMLAMRDSRYKRAVAKMAVQTKLIPAVEEVQATPSLS